MVGALLVHKPELRPCPWTDIWTSARIPFQETQHLGSSKQNAPQQKHSMAVIFALGLSESCLSAFLSNNYGSTLPCFYSGDQKQLTLELVVIFRWFQSGKGFCKAFTTAPNVQAEVWIDPSTLEGAKNDCLQEGSIWTKTGQNSMKFEGWLKPRPRPRHNCEYAISRRRTQA